ncbi:hypothetical protein AVEN_179520-1 [Araneus ventricosus]|uniref:Uncharacterized protein n=1 Tax=Araneus ventricosus TaxID=182803 RepID=A0A4Y2IZB1_ARAVE|nr:hypothetical protein AVEN_179520-1 [Araneus ventricosus]
MEDDLEYLKVSFQKILFQLNTADNVQMHKSRIPNEVFVKLPDVSLPEFNGNIDNWSNFKAQFNSLITNDSTLNETQKLFYLRSVLKGDAKLVETQECTFNSLMKVLIDRYENKRLIVSNHILNILNIEKIHLESAKDLRNLVDAISKSLRGLKLLELEANELVHQILINVVIEKIDKETRKQYEMSLTTNEFPNWDKFIEFLRKRSQVLEIINGTHQQTRVKITNYGKNKNFMLKSTSKNICVLCKGGHSIYNCSAFLEMTPLQRFDISKKHKLCLNCLYNSPKLSDCKSKYSCPFCEGKHNRLLCRNQNIRSPPNSDMTPTLQTGETPSPSHPVAPDLSTPSVGGESTLHTLSLTNKIKNAALLSIAVVWVYSPIRSGYVQGRVLLDCGSQSHFLTSQFASELGLSRRKINVPISGLSGSTTNAKWIASTMICNGNSSFSSLIDLLVVPKIRDFVPSNVLHIGQLNIPKRSELADPKFHKPGKIDMFIGAELFYKIIKDGKIHSSSKLLFQNSVFVYIASETVASNNSEQFCGLISQRENIENTLQKFWEIEDLSAERQLNKEAELCEIHFQKTHCRDNNGRYIVQMPLIEEDLNSLGYSRKV